ncbi:MAG: T6SS phospholipase effector Tle1-like catalytic domain-containing protein [Shimia sp.]|uniref:T6SS phospholipase effector Tle1-like catalytic domain-containing protein n=1 Tax=Shimia sp. TaxID=1954381 RepID=UPI00405865BB
MSRKLIICFDGTGNEVEKNESNILRLYKCLKHDDTQLVYYEPGVGTLSTRPFAQNMFSKVRLVLGLASGLGLHENVMHAYQFLCENHREGDRLYFFGYSRGAYTARVLAGFINDFGLVAPHEMHLIGPVFKTWRKIGRNAAPEEYAPLRISEQFFHIRRPSIRFLGLWDTVSSMIRIRPKWGAFLEFGSHSSLDENPSVKAVRHALSIDEIRRFFRHQFWTEGQDYHGTRFKSKTNPPPQDVNQVWFPGTHTDVAGSVPEKEAGLSKITMEWMRAELDSLGVDKLEFRKEFYNRYVLGKKDKVTERMGLEIAEPDPLAPLHSQMKLRKFWPVLEIFPRFVSRSRWPNQKGWFGYYFPVAQPRYIPHGSNIDPSAFKRRAELSDYAPENLHNFPEEDAPS